MSAVVTVYAPGLLGPLPRQAIEALNFTTQGPLSCQLHSAKKLNSSEQGYAATLSSLFGLTDFPFAAAARLRETGLVDNQYWSRFDPVYIQIGATDAVLQHDDNMSLSVEEAAELVLTINEHLADFAWQVEVIHPARWYVKTSSAFHLRCPSVYELRGQSIRNAQVTGTHASEWRRLSNEIQMLLHQHPVNAQRDLNNVTGINSIWMWGGGQLSEVPPKLRWDTVYSNDLAVQGMALYCGCQVKDISMLDVDEIGESGEVLIVDNRAYHALQQYDLQAWYEHMQTISNYLMRLVKARHYPTLLPGREQEYRLEKLRFWQGFRCPSFAEHLT